MHLFTFSPSLLVLQLCRALSDFTQAQPDSTSLPDWCFLVERCSGCPCPVLHKHK